jgi:hypothetical protein
MGGSMKTKSGDIIMQNKVFGWIALGTTAILSIPLIAMRFTPEVDWSLFDFTIMGALVFGAASLFVVVARATPRKYRLLMGFVILGAFLLVWAHLAVGVVDSWPLAGS